MHPGKMYAELYSYVFIVKLLKPPAVHTWGWVFFHGGGSLLHKPKFRKGGSIFLGEFSDIIAFLLPNIFGKPRMGGMSSWGWTF